MAESISKEVARQANPLAVVAKYQNELGKSMPAAIRGDVGRWMMVAEMAVRKNPKLLSIVQADQGASLMRALIECARLGHEPGTKYFYLVPRGNQISGEEGYHGIIKRVLNSGHYQKVLARTVFEGDEYSFDPLTDQLPTHVPASGDRGKPVSAYAFALHWDGTPTTVAEASPERIAAAKAKSYGTDRKDSPWQSVTGVMYRKTAIRELEPYVHTSAEPQPRQDNAGSRGAVMDPSTYDDAEPLDADVLDITADQIAEHDGEGAL
ncbi:recombinase RecT [Nocardia brasiliensis]|uniref:recombinase RecT n=1 Tax=Nocardia brasiliensis TaxID=37326 RepID=UPI002455C64B|nr:recombinase RecT [Nocardia brasiliensis]